MHMVLSRAGNRRRERKVLLLSMRRKKNVETLINKKVQIWIVFLIDTIKQMQNNKKCYLVKLHEIGRRSIELLNIS